MPLNWSHRLKFKLVVALMVSLIFRLCVSSFRLKILQIKDGFSHDRCLYFSIILLHRFLTYVTYFKVRRIVFKKYSQHSFVNTIYFFVFCSTTKHLNKWTIIEI